MAESSISATAIPREINLGIQKPVATPAYTRRFKSVAQNPNVTAGSQVQITLDTAQPGSFIDTLSSYLSFGLQLTNSSQTKGYYVAFSAAGAHSIIRSMRIYVQGVPIEEITEYNALVEWLHDLSGIPDYTDRSSKSRYYANTMFDEQSIYVPANSTKTLNVQMPIISGVLGTMAEKMFPSMLVAPGNCYMQFDLSSAVNALRIQEIDLSELTVGNRVVGYPYWADNQTDALKPFVTDNMKLMRQGIPRLGVADLWSARLKKEELNSSCTDTSYGGATDPTQNYTSSVYTPGSTLNSIQFINGNMDMSVGSYSQNIAHGVMDNIIDDCPLDLPIYNLVQQNTLIEIARTGVATGAATAAETQWYFAKGHVQTITTEERIGGGMFWNDGTGNYANPNADANNKSYYARTEYGMAKTPSYRQVGQNGVTHNAQSQFAVFDTVMPIARDTEAIAVYNSTTLAPVTTDRLWYGAGLLVNGSKAPNAEYRMTSPSSNEFTYSVMNLEYVGKQVVVGDDVARAIIERAASGDISIHTQSYRQYPANIPVNSWKYNVESAYDLYSSLKDKLIDGAPLWNMFNRTGTISPQSLIIPAKISSANAIYCIFRNAQGVEDFRFDSLRRITIGMDDLKSNAVTVQLRIGNELIPQSPIVSCNEALEELLKAHHMDGFYGTQEKMGSVVANATYYAPDPSMSMILNRGKYAANYTAYAGTVSSSGGNITGNSILSADTGFTNLINATTNVVANAGTRLPSYTPRNDFNSQILCPHPSSVLFTFPEFAEFSTSNANTGLAKTNFGPGEDANYNFNVGGRSFLTNLEPQASAFYYGIVGSGITSYYVNSAMNQESWDFSTGSNLYNTNAAIYQDNKTMGQVTCFAETQEDYAKRQARWKTAVRKAFFGGTYSEGKHQIVDPSKPNFMSPTGQHTGRYSTFMLGFDLDTFSHNTDTIRSGHYLGNNTVSLNTSTLYVQDNSPCNMPLMQSVRMDTYVLHDLRLSFQAGGIVQAFY